MPHPAAPPTYIDRPHLLRRLVDDLARQTEIAIDTEANSMFAYRERLCLVQISTRRRDYLVDPLADVDVGELAPVLADPGVLKVLHGAEFDVLLLKRTRPFEIAGLYDTRVAVASLGYSATGLAAALEENLGVKIDKAHQRSDWGARPLSDGQREYARRDTCHLLPLAEALRARIREAGAPHAEEVAAECRRLEALEPSPEREDPLAWTRIKGALGLDGRGRRALEQLDAWRLERARARDVPPFKVLGSEVLLRLAAALPRSSAELDRLEILPRRSAERLRRPLLDALNQAAKMRPLPKPETTPSRPELRLDPRSQTTFDRLRRQRKAEAQRRATDPSLLLPRATLLALAELRPAPRDLDELDATGLLEAWRLRHAGPWILRALRG